MKLELTCTPLKLFWRIWELNLKLGHVLTARSKLEKGASIFRLVAAGTFVDNITSHCQRLKQLLSSSANNLKKEEEKERKKFEIIFVIKYYEESCPEEWRKSLHKLERHIQWLSAVVRAYSKAESSLSRINGGSIFLTVLVKHIKTEKERYQRELHRYTELRDKNLKRLPELWV
ncbi:MAG: hypothetical protein QXU62_08060 [Thermofilaceae archaeon]